MNWTIRHPGYSDLNRFADGELDEAVHGRVAAHLAGCPRCREQVSLIRRLGREIRELPTPAATDRLLEGALARRQNGERVLLPQSDTGSRRTEPRVPLRAAIAAGLLIGASLVVSVQVLQADKPGLRILPEQPMAGEMLRMEYRGGALFADETHLKLRARYRTAEEDVWQLIAGILVRDEDGVFRTDVQLPDSVVYAAFAVEDLHGERLDSNNRQLWDVMVHGEEGKPTLAGLFARMEDLEPRDWGDAYETALRMTELYPDEPQSWGARVSFELSLFERDSVLKAHRANYRLLAEQASEGSNNTAEQMAWLSLYAINLGDLSSAEVWIRESLRHGTRTKALQDAQVLLIAMRDLDRPDVQLEKLEEVWHSFPGGVKSAADYSFNLARSMGDSAAVSAWLPRYLASFAPQEQRLFPTSEEGDRPLRAHIEWDRIANAHIGVDSSSVWRPLQIPVREFFTDQVEVAQESQVRLADLALLSGDSATAAELASRAAQLSWSSQAILDATRILARTSDRRALEEPLARALADPATRAAARQLADSLRVDVDQLAPRVEENKQILREHVLSSAIVDYIDAAVELEYAGRSLSFSEIHRGTPAVVAFFSRYSAPSLEQLERFPELVQKLEAVGAQLILVDMQAGGDLEAVIASLGFDLDVYADVTGAARAAFGSSKAPDYFVLDEQGRIRFEHSEFDELERQIEALQRSSTIFAADFGKN